MKQKLLKIVNLLLALAFTLLILSSAFRTSMDYSLYRKVHPLFGYTFATLALIHIYLNFGWIKSNYLKGKRKA